MFRKLTLPLLRPIMAMVIILTVIQAFQVFDIVAVATGGRPREASNVLTLPAIYIRLDLASLISATRRPCRWRCS